MTRPRVRQRNSPQTQFCCTLFFVLKCGKLTSTKRIIPMPYCTFIYCPFPFWWQPGGHDAQITTAKPYIIAGGFHHSFLSCFHLHCALLPENSLLIWTLSSAGKNPMSHWSFKHPLLFILWLAILHTVELTNSPRYNAILAILGVCEKWEDIE